MYRPSLHDTIIRNAKENINNAHFTGDILNNENTNGFD